MPDAALNHLDAILQTLCPTVMAPIHEGLSPLAEDGHRFVSARDGLHVELRRPWLHARWPVAESVIELPYGPADTFVHFAFGAEIATHLGRFIAEARAALPSEHACWLAFDRATGLLTYEGANVLSATSGHIEYRRPRLPANRVLAVDIHSHGSGRPFFSVTDDADALDDAKLEIVVGHLDRLAPSVVCRLSLIGGLRVDYSNWLTALLYP
jgi:PRTRC genetic system protein A